MYQNIGKKIQGIAKVFAWLVYGFGELIENTKKIADKK